MSERVYTDPGDAEAVEILRRCQWAGLGGSLEFDGHVYGPDWVAHVGQWEGMARTPLEAVKRAQARFRARSPHTADHLWGHGNEDASACCGRPPEKHPPASDEEATA